MLVKNVDFTVRHKNILIFISKFDKFYESMVIGYNIENNEIYRIEIKGTKYQLEGNEEKAKIVLNEISNFIKNYTPEYDINEMDEQLLKLIKQRDKLNKLINAECHKIENFKSGNHKFIWE